MSEQTYGTEARTGWTGWIVFASVMMMVGGALNAFYGLIALLNDDWVVWGNKGAVYFDITTWGWIMLIWGAIVFFCGIGLLSGNLFARTIAVVLAALSIIVNFFFIPVYPIWALTVMVIGVLVIWALTAHGSEMKTS